MSRPHGSGQTVSLAGYFLYFNGWIALSFSVGYACICFMGGLPYSWTYGLFGLCCIAVTYGRDNLLDIPQDRTSWKEQGASWLDRHKMPYRLFLHCAGITGVYLGLKYFHQAWPVWIGLAAAVYFYQRSEGAPVIRYGFLKPLTIAVSWWLLQIAAPFYLFSTHASLSTLVMLSQVCVPGYFTAVVLSDFRHSRPESGKWMTRPPYLRWRTFVFLLYGVLASSGLCAVFQWETPGRYWVLGTHLMYAVTPALWLPVRAKPWGDGVVDALGGMHLLALVAGFPFFF